MKICSLCDNEFQLKPGKPGLSTHCPDCSEETVTKFTGNMIYDHKTGASIQINTNPKLTEYINNSTKLRNKGSNLGNNLKVSSTLAKTEGACLLAVDGRSRRRD